MVKARISKIEAKKLIFDFIESLKKNNLPLGKVILYGSYARGNPRDYSDIDLVVVSDKIPANRWKAQAILSKAMQSEEDYSYIIEPIGYSTKEYENAESGSFLQEVKERGEVVYSE